MAPGLTNFTPNFGSIPQLQTPNFSSLGSLTAAANQPQIGGFDYASLGFPKTDLSLGQNQGRGGFDLGLMQDGKINWDNMGSLAKGAAGLTQAGFGVANYFEQKKQNEKAREDADKMLKMQQEMNALNAAGQDAYMKQKGWISGDSKYSQLVDSLTNTALA